MGRTRWQRQRQVACGLRGVGELLEIAVFTYKRRRDQPLAWAAVLYFDLDLSRVALCMSTSTTYFNGTLPGLTHRVTVPGLVYNQQTCKS